MVVTEDGAIVVIVAKQERETQMNYKSVGYVRYINKQLEMLLQMHTVS